MDDFFLSNDVITSSTPKRIMQVITFGGEGQVCLQSRSLATTSLQEHYAFTPEKAIELGQALIEAGERKRSDGKRDMVD